ncbi:hypothetical protein ON010_g8789 [Phytophthora cinnamomi]|nr:hypothetical protein ON010_g8789 [Phytophthora cinnamomi]
MSNFVKIDNTCLVQNGLNNTWKYSFPGSSCNFDNVEASIQSISLYNSEFNVDSLQFVNTSFQIEVPTAATTTTLSVNLADGYYLYSDINRNIQTALVTAGAYLIDSKGNQVFYIQFEENSTYYACQLDCSATPTSLPTGYTRPTTGLYSTGGTGLPTTSRVPRLIISNAAFGSLLGFTSGTYPAASTTTSTSLLSNAIPQISPSSSYVVRCDLIKNDFVASGDIMAVFDKGDAGIGKQIQYFPSNATWCKTHDGARSTITLSIWSQNDQPVHFRDNSVNMMILLRKRR